MATNEQPEPTPATRADATDQAAIARVYDEHAALEYERLDRSLRHRAEFELTAELLAEYLPPQAKVLDVGAGPGRYAEHLLRAGCQVALTDLSASSLRLFEQRIGPDLAERVLFCRQGSATDLAWVAAGSFDAVLLMGPLYHLVTSEERRLALQGAWRALRPDGMLVASDISPYKPLADAIADGDQAEVERLRDGGTTMHLGMEQHRTWPRQARQELTDAGFTLLRIRNLEGLASLMDPAGLAAQDAERFLAMLRATGELADLLGATLHFVCVAQR